MCTCAYQWLPTWPASVTTGTCVRGAPCHAHHLCVAMDGPLYACLHTSLRMRHLRTLGRPIRLGLGQERRPVAAPVWRMVAWMLWVIGSV